MTALFLENGRPSQTIPHRDRGLAYGDGLFETIKVCHGKPQFLAHHLTRLQRGVERLSLNLDESILRREISTLIELHECSLSVLKIIITRGGGLRGYRYQPCVPANRYLSVEPLDPLYIARMQAGVKMFLCDQRLPIDPSLAGIKHLNRLGNVMARAEFSSNALGEGLMLDAQGRVVEGTMSNLFVVKGSELMTPSVQRCGVAGVIREIVLSDIAPREGLSGRVCDLYVSDLVEADELFICNSLIGICPVLAVGCMRWEAGPVTARLQQILDGWR